MKIFTLIILDGATKVADEPKTNLAQHQRIKLEPGKCRRMGDARVTTTKKMTQAKIKCARFIE